VERYVRGAFKYHLLDNLGFKSGNKFVYQASQDKVFIVENVDLIVFLR
jgi:hypothetical protein